MNNTRAWGWIYHSTNQNTTRALFSYISNVLRTKQNSKIHNKLIIRMSQATTVKTFITREHYIKR